MTREIRDHINDVLEAMRHAEEFIGKTVYAILGHN